MEALLAALEQSTIGDAMRSWRWLYPIVNVAHIFGISLLFGAVVTLDLRYLGVWRSVDRDILSRVLVPVALAGFVLAVLAGALLFTTDAQKYADMALFQVKLGLIAFAIANIIWLAQKRAAAAALVSLVCWTGAIICGRFIGYL